MVPIAPSSMTMRVRGSCSMVILTSIVMRRIHQSENGMIDSIAGIAKRLCVEIHRKGKDRGFLIAFEGPDGSGKTTQRKLFKDWLVGEGYSVTTTKWNSSKLIKPIIKAR